MNINPKADLMIAPPNPHKPGPRPAAPSANAVSSDLWTLEQAKEYRDNDRELGDNADQIKAAAQDMGDKLYARSQAMLATIERENREFLASENREYNKLIATANVVEDIVKGNTITRPPMAPAAGWAASDRYVDGEPLRNGQTMRGYAQARGHADPGEHLSLNKVLKGALFGDWRGADTERQAMNAMSGASGTAGGVLIPTTLSASIIDLARAQARVVQAGAQVVPMSNRTITVPKWTQDPTPTWRAENAAVSETDGALDSITLTAKSLAGIVRVSRELIEDTDIDLQLAQRIAASVALQFDVAALYGAGGNAPTGVKNVAAVTKTSMGANGAAITSWDTLVDAVGRLRDKNEDPTAAIMADRSARALAKLKETGGAYVAPPTYLDGIERLTTSIVQTNLTVGTSNDTSDIFTADWRQLYLGVRTNLVIQLNEAYSGFGQVGLMIWFRGDVQVARASAFDVVTGVK